MSLAQLPPWLIEKLNNPPAAGDGVHRWLFDVARQLHYHMPPKEIFQLLAARIAYCGRYVPQAEIIGAINSSAKVQWQPDGTGCGSAAADHSYPASQPKWPRPRMLEIQKIVNASVGLADLVEQSPQRFDNDQSHAEEIIDVIFPGNPLLCIGKSRSLFATRRRETWRNRLAEMPLIVPNPMLTILGQTKEGKHSEHTLQRTGRQVYQVIEFDFSLTNRDGGTQSCWAPLVRTWCERDITVADACAALLLHLHLASKLPLVLAVHSGGKSIHGWFRVFELSLEERFRFMRYAVELGADRATWCRSQFVRVPDGLRDNGRRQTTFYFNPQEAIKA